MTVLKVIKDARTLITDPERWTQGQWARSSEGWATFVRSPMASCWSALGAIIKCIEDEDFGKVQLAFGENSRNLTDFNDTHTHAEVLELFDKAISRLEKTHGP